MASQEQFSIEQLVTRLAAYEALAANVARLLIATNTAAVLDFSNPSSAPFVAPAVASVASTVSVVVTI
jgi:hypothetical protein